MPRVIPDACELALNKAHLENLSGDLGASIADLVSQYRDFNIAIKWRDMEDSRARKIELVRDAHGKYILPALSPQNLELGQITVLSEAWRPTQLFDGSHGKGLFNIRRARGIWTMSYGEQFDPNSEVNQTLTAIQTALSVVPSVDAFEFILSIERDKTLDLNDSKSPKEASENQLFEESEFARKIYRKNRISKTIFDRIVRLQRTGLPAMEILTHSEISLSESMPVKMGDFILRDVQIKELRTNPEKSAMLFENDDSLQIVFSYIRRRFNSVTTAR